MDKFLSRAAWRVRLDHWVFWMGVAYFGLVCVIIGLYVVYGKAARDENVRRAERQATTVAAYQTCIASIPELRKVSTHLAGVTELADVLVANSAAALAVTPRSDPAYLVRVANLERLRVAGRKIAVVSAIPTPTVLQCKQRRDAELKG